jgi:gas vesicle protein
MKTKKFLGGLALGAILGGAMGLFVSPGKGKENREKFKKVSKKVSEELITNVTKAKTVGKKEYEEIVENIVKKYKKDDLLSMAAWGEIAAELKLRWKDIQKEMKKTPAKKK